MPTEPHSSFPWPGLQSAACAWRVAVRLLSCSSASSLRDHSVQWKQILFGSLFFSAFGILGASSVMVSYSFTSIQFEPHGEQAEIVLKETKENKYFLFFFHFFLYIFTFLFPFFIKESVNCVCLKAIGILPAWQLPKGWSALRPASQDVSLYYSLGLSSYTTTLPPHSPIEAVLLNGNERAGLKKKKKVQTKNTRKRQTQPAKEKAWT